MSTTAPDSLLTFDDFAAMARLKRSTVRTMAKDGRIPCVRLGARSIRITRQAAENFILDRATATAEIARPTIMAIRANDSRWDRLVTQLASQLVQLQPAVEKILFSQADKAMPACRLLSDQAEVIGQSLDLLIEAVRQFNHTSAMVLADCVPKPTPAAADGDPT